MSGVGWAKMMQENSLHQQANTTNMIPNVKLPPKNANIPTRPAPPPPSALAALAELKIQVT